MSGVGWDDPTIFGMAFLAIISLLVSHGTCGVACNFYNLVSSFATIVAIP